jgi:endogenous inhibitor of DNA gyrase (YacG/DUF329 family)
MSKPDSFQKCPTCGQRFAVDLSNVNMPFCSERCKLADLHRWMSEEIGLPTGSSELEDGEEPEPETSRREWKFD